MAAIKALRESAVKTDDRTKKSADVCNPPGNFVFTLRYATCQPLYLACEPLSVLREALTSDFFSILKNHVARQEKYEKYIYNWRCNYSVPRAVFLSVGRSVSRLIGRSVIFS